MFVRELISTHAKRAHRILMDFVLIHIFLINLGVHVGF